MSEIKFFCTHCCSKIGATIDDAGITFPCPVCQFELVVPQVSVVENHLQGAAAEPPNPEEYYQPKGHHEFPHCEPEDVGQKPTSMFRRWVHQASQSEVSRLQFRVAICCCILLPTLIFFLCGTPSEGPAVEVSQKSSSTPSDTQASERAAPVPSGKQKANKAAYEAYMNGYNDPKAGDIAEALAERLSGDELKAAALMVVGARDRRAHLPIRFTLVD